MKNPNSHIEEFLNYYYSFDKEPGYAVLLKGKWGTGKTWFINKTLKSFEGMDGKHLYVSLYGITSFDQIEDEFFKQLHPLLSSKSMALTGKIAKGILKTTLKIDLDGDDKADANVSAQAPNIDLPDYLTNTNGFVIVFDDLERASIDLNSLLGYINHYVEHQGYKVIIVANEQEILDQADSGESSLKTSYIRIKEKLIGKTFAIEPDLQGALDNFISEINDENVREIFINNINVISELYNNSEYQNLRHLKQALWDFERLMSFVSEDAATKDGLIDHLLKIFLILSFEVKSGNILPADIPSLKLWFMSRFIHQDRKKTDETVYQKISKKYNNVNFRDLLIDESIWIDFFDKGCFSSDRMQESFEKSKYYKNKNTPDWVKLWSLTNLSDNEFDLLLDSVEKDFYGEVFTEIGIIKHIFGIFIFLSNHNLISKSKSEILKFSFKYIENLKIKGLLEEEAFKSDIFREHDSWGGLCFIERETEEFKELIRHLDKLKNQVVIESYPDAGSELLSLIHTEPDLFYSKIVHGNNTENLYYKTPIFTHITPQKFVAFFVSAKPDSRNTVCYAFAERYKFDQFNDLLLPELDWLKKVIDLLDEEKEKRKGKISCYQLKINIDKYFRLAFEMLEKYKSSRSF